VLQVARELATNFGPLGVPVCVAGCAPTCNTRVAGSPPAPRLREMASRTGRTVLPGITNSAVSGSETIFRIISDGARNSGRETGRDFGSSGMNAEQLPRFSTPQGLVSCGERDGLLVENGLRLSTPPTLVGGEGDHYSWFPGDELLHRGPKIGGVEVFRRRSSSPSRSPQGASPRGVAHKMEVIRRPPLTESNSTGRLIVEASPVLRSPPLPKGR
jgi:hypothetical protein